MKRHKKAFTIVELLTAIAIIAILIGILVPSLVTVRNMAKKTAQKAQLMAIETGLLTYRNDFGDYPESAITNESGQIYCGAQKLAEAMLGLDLMGFHPQSAWRPNGLDRNNNQLYSVAGMTNLYPDWDTNLKQRKGHYLDLEKSNAFRLGNLVGREGLFNNYASQNLAPDTYVLCDVFGVRKLSVGGKNINAGAPILYYKANTSSKRFMDAAYPDRIYNVYDNDAIVKLGKLNQNGNPTEGHSLGKIVDNFYLPDFRGGIRDLRMNESGVAWPHNADSYILISAGPDGEYGTEDDIRNFAN